MWPAHLTGLCEDPRTSQVQKCGFLRQVSKGQQLLLITFPDLLPWSLQMIYDSVKCAPPQILHCAPLSNGAAVLTEAGL